MAEIVATLLEQMSRTHSLALVDTMEYLRRSGRVKGITASVGGILQMKPLLHVYDGEVTPERLRTWRRGEDRLVEWLESLAPLEKLTLLHISAPERLEKLRQRILPLLPTPDPLIVDVTPLFGVHFGPGVIGVSCMQRKQSSGE